MKKYLLLAMALSFGVTASACAANPFSDVPAGHWAYGSIEQLAIDGVIDGYGEDTFNGDKLMTRYEMAQIIAKAMAKGANVDKLAAEFADELDALGVRVAKLEKGADAVKITGEVRAHYNDSDVGLHNAVLRTRIYINGQINDNWSYTGRLQNEQNLLNDAGEEDVKFNLAYVSGRLGGMQVEAGRQNIMPHAGNVIDAISDGVKLSYGDKVKFNAYYGKALDPDLQEPNYKGFFSQNKESEIYIVDIATKLGAADVYATYYKSDLEYKKDIINLGASFDVAKDLVLRTEYAYGDSSDKGNRLSHHGWNAGLAYKGAKADEANSWGVYANYYDMPASTYVYSTNSAYANYFIAWAEDPYWLPYEDDPAQNKDGYKGFEIGANYALAKNMVAAVKYFDLTTRRGDLSDKTIWSEVVFTF